MDKNTVVNDAVILSQIIRLLDQVDGSYNSTISVHLSLAKWRVIRSLDHILPILQKGGSANIEQAA